MKSIHEKLIAALQTRLESILIISAYKTDLGKNVFEWLDRPLNADELPGIIYRDPNNNPSALTVGGVQHNLVIECDIAAASADDLRKARADLTVALGTDLEWGTLAEDTTLPEEVTEVDQSGNQYFSVTVRFEIIYTTERFNPYA